MNEELKPQKGDIFIEPGIYGGWKVYIYESEWRGWQDKLGYLTKREEYVESLISGMSLYQEDRDGRKYYRTPAPTSENVTLKGNGHVQVSVTSLPQPLDGASIATIQNNPTRKRQETRALKDGKQITVGTYNRTTVARVITFQCSHCGNTVTQERYPSPKPMYCSDECRKEVEREQTRLRVQRLRNARKQASN